MINLNIPIYRANRLDGLGNIEGYLVKQDDSEQLAIVSGFNLSIIYGLVCPHNIDPTTLAIHFPDIQIKDLFFGLDNAKGASIIEALFIEDNTPFKGVAMHTHYGYVFYDKNDDWVHISKLWDIKAIGIQK